MSRGSKCKEFDEKVALSAIGQAINYIILDQTNYGKGLKEGWYEQAAGAAMESLAFALDKLVQDYYDNNNKRKRAMDIDI